MPERSRSLALVTACLLYRCFVAEKPEAVERPGLPDTLRGLGLSEANGECQILSYPCNGHALNASTLLSKVFLSRLPVLLRDCSRGDFFPIPGTIESGALERIKEDHGDHEVHLEEHDSNQAQFEVGSVLGEIEGRDVNLRTYLSDADGDYGKEFLPLWAFNVDVQSLQGILSEYNNSAELHAEDAMRQFEHVTGSIGPRGAEFAFHYHGAAWLWLGRGKKLFVTRPFEQAPTSDQLWRSPTEWLQTLRKEPSSAGHDDGLRLCILRPGDVLFLPPAMWHATLNLEPSVAVGGLQEGVRATDEFRDNMTAWLKTLQSYCEASNESYLEEQKEKLLDHRLSDMLYWLRSSFEICRRSNSMDRGLDLAEGYFERILSAERQHLASGQNVRMAGRLILGFLARILGALPAAPTEERHGPDEEAHPEIVAMEARVRRMGTRIWDELAERWPEWDLGRNSRERELLELFEVWIRNEGLSRAEALNRLREAQQGSVAQPLIFFSVICGGAFLLLHFWWNRRGEKPAPASAES